MRNVTDIIFQLTTAILWLQILKARPAAPTLPGERYGIGSLAQFISTMSQSLPSLAKTRFRMAAAKLSQGRLPPLSVPGQAGGLDGAGGDLRRGSILSVKGDAPAVSHAQLGSALDIVHESSADQAESRV